MQQLATDIWKSLGLEIVIFVVTLICALALRWASPKQGDSPSSRKQVGTLKKESSSGEPATTFRSARQGRAEHTPSSRYASDDYATDQPTQRTPSQIMDEAVASLNEWQGGGGRSVTRALALYSELRQLLRAMGQKMPEGTADSRHRPAELYAGLVHVVIRSGKHNLLDMIIDDMVQQGVPRQLAFYESAMKQLAGQKQFRHALRIYDRLAADGLETTAVTCSCLVRFAAEVGDLQRATEFFTKLAALTTPSIRAYMTILGVHSKRQDWPATIATVKEMRDKGVPVDSLALNVALSTGVAADQAAAVEELLAEAEQIKPFMPDVVSYNTLAKVFAQRASSADAVKVLERMLRHNVRPNAITFNTVMDAMVRASRPEDAWKLLQEMRSCSYKPDRFTCSILVKGLSMGGAASEAAIARALALLEEAELCLDNNLRSSLYHAVAEAAVQAQNTMLLLKVTSQMRAHGVMTSPVLQKSMVQALRLAGLENLPLQ